jgi:hypothetical protein
VSGSAAQSHELGFRNRTAGLASSGTRRAEQGIACAIRVVTGPNGLHGVLLRLRHPDAQRGIWVTRRTVNLTSLDVAKNVAWS